MASSLIRSASNGNIPWATQRPNYEKCYTRNVMFQPVSKCRICGNSELEPILDLGVQHLTGVFPKCVNDEPPAAPLELVKCHQASGTCGLLQLKHSTDPGAMYGANYGYRSGLNRSMVEHLHHRAARIKTAVTLRPRDTVLDIGSNDGTLLDRKSVV